MFYLYNGLQSHHISYVMNSTWLPFESRFMHVHQSIRTGMWCIYVKTGNVLCITCRNVRDCVGHLSYLYTHISYLSTLISTFTLAMSYKTNFQPAHPPARRACLPDLLTDRRLRIPPRTLRLTSYVHLWWQTCIRRIKYTFTFPSLVLPNDLTAGRFYSNVLCEWLDIAAPTAVFISHPSRYYAMCSSRIFSLCSRIWLL